MSNYLLSATSKKMEYVDFQKNIEYSFSSKKLSYEGFDVKKVTLYDPNTINMIVYKYLYYSYERLCRYIDDVINSDDAQDDTALCLDEISKYNDILENKYKRYLKKKQYIFFLEKLAMMNKLLNDKIIMLNSNKRAR